MMPLQHHSVVCEEAVLTSRSIRPYDSSSAGPDLMAATYLSCTHLPEPGCPRLSRAAVEGTRSKGGRSCGAPPAHLKLLFRTLFLKLTVSPGSHACADVCDLAGPRTGFGSGVGRWILDPPFDVDHETSGFVRLVTAMLRPAPTHLFLSDFSQRLHTRMRS